MAEKSIPRVENGKASRCCAGCAATEKSLMAPHANARNYAGPLYCVSCNPRFAGGGDAALRLLVTR
jgi:hypothetical protein